MSNKVLRDALERHRKNVESGEYKGRKRDYVQGNLSQILELVAAGVPQDEILAAFEKDGVKMSKRYFSTLLGEVRQYGRVLMPNHRDVPDIR